MRRCLQMLLTTTLLVPATISIAQGPQRSADAEVMARLSYDNSGDVRPDIRHICVAVSREGEYRIVRATETGQLELLHGKMPREELNRLSTLLGAVEFRHSSGQYGGIVLQKSETFAAEIPQQWPEPVWRSQWLNADGSNPFPAPVSKVADWLKGFQPKDAKRSEYIRHTDVCPTAGMRLLQPSVADNSHR